MKIKIKQLTAILLITLMVLPLVSVGAVPPMPHKFYGTVTVDGLPAPDGLPVTIVIAVPVGHARARTVGHDFEYTGYTSGGTYGLDEPFLVPTDDPDTTEIEGGVNGDIMYFWVDNDNYVGSYVFENGAITELNLDYSTNIVELQLYEGWNLIGLPFAPVDTSIEVVLGDIMIYVESVWSYDGETGHWSSYAPGAPSNLDEMVEDKGYWIKVLTDTMLTVQGRGTIVVEVSPLDGKTIQIGYIASTTTALNTDIPLFQEIIEPDLNAYAESLGLDVTFEFIIEDATGQAAVHLEKVQGFKAMGIDIFIGGLWSSQAQAALSYVNNNDMLMISSSSTSPLLAIPNDRLFRISPTDSVQAPAIAEMWSSWGADAILIIQRADIWADGISDLLIPDLEARGITVIERIRYAAEVTEFSGYLATMDDLLGDAIAVYGADRVGVQMLSFSEDVVMMVQSADYSNVRSVIFMGTDASAGSQGMIDDAGGLQNAVGVFSSLMTPPNSWKWEEFEERYFDLVGQPANFYTATQYDAAWVIALSILQTGSTDATIVAEALPMVSRNYYGTSGWVDLDDNGDRNPGIFDIWGFSEIAEDGFIKYGQYNGIEITINWYDDVLAANGFTRPGPH